MLDEKAINLGIKDSLTQQSRLYKAMENIAPKAAEEANTQLGRIMQGVGKKLGTRNKAVQGLAALTGIGVFGASAAYALPLTVATGLGFLLYKGGKLIINPQARIYLGKILETSGKLLSTEEKSAIKGLLNKYE